ncbi:MAG TPA: type II secretion system F family protein [Nocardioidaceae bacterium]|nr:type II secretion system F family protein [Nocardioidaceae bacterium]
MSGWLVVVAAASSATAAACLIPGATVPTRVLAALPARGAVTAAGSAGARERSPAARDPVARLRLPLALVVGAGAALLVGGWPGAALGPVVAGVAWRVLGGLEPASVRRRREALHRALPHAVDLMAASLAVGSSPTRAVELVAPAVDPPMRQELELVAGRLALGVDPVRVWSEVAGDPELGALGRCLARALESGASVSEAMHRLAEDLRRAARADVEARARAVGVRAAAPLGLCLLPAFILTGIVPLVAGSVQALLLGR